MLYTVFFFFGPIWPSVVLIMIYINILLTVPLKNLFITSFCLFAISRYGRVNYVLARRIELLEEVKRLQKSLGVPGDASYTCETAGYFFLYQVSD